MNKQVNKRKKTEKRNSTEKGRKVEKRKYAKKGKKGKKFLQYIQKIIPIFFSVISIFISVISVWIAMKESRKNELILKPRFSLEKDTKTDKDNSFIWKIRNLGGAINNATINPTVQITFFIYDYEEKKDKKVTLGIFDYYSSYKYSNSDTSFYVNDDKKDELESFIKKYEDKISLDGFSCRECRIDHYFGLHYDDYEGNSCDETYKMDDDEFEDSFGHNIVNDNRKRLEKISKMPKADIDVSLEFHDKTLIPVNYKNAITEKIIKSEQEYDDYLFSVILDLVDSKDKPVNKMLGDVILSKGTLWKRDLNTGTLFKVMDNVKEYGFTEEFHLTWITKKGELYMME